MKKFILFFCFLGLLKTYAQSELVSTGTGAAYILSVPGSFSLRPGIQITFKAHTACAASATINVSGTGAIQIRKLGNTLPLVAGDILTDQVVTLVYDGSFWQMTSSLGNVASSPNYWDLNSINIYNNNIGHVGVGTSTPGKLGGANRYFTLAGTEIFSSIGQPSLELVGLSSGLNSFAGRLDFIGLEAITNNSIPRARIEARSGNSQSLAGQMLFYINQNGTSGGLLERMRLRESGELAIGNNGGIVTGSLLSVGSSSQFAVNGSGNLIRINNVPYSWPSNNVAGMLTNDGSGNLSWSPTSSLVTGTGVATRVAFWDGTNSLNSNTNLFWDNTNNRLGIGTSSPLVPLHVASSGVPAIGIQNAGTISTSGVGIARLNFTDAQAPNGQQASILAVRDAASGGPGDLPTALTFLTTPDASSTPAERVRITNNGNVGIGTAAPLKRLHVENSAAGSDTLGNIAVYHNSTGNGIALSAIANNTGIAAGTTTYAQARLAGYFATPAGTTDFGIWSRSSGWAGIFDNINRPTSYVGIGGLGSGNNLVVNHTTTTVSDPAQVNTYTYNGSSAGINAALRIDATNNTSGTNVASHGIYITANNNSTGGGASALGVGAYVSGTNANGEKKGLEGSATGAGTTNYGIVGNASGATTNWAGFFMGGNVFIQNNLGVGTTPSAKLDVNGTFKLGPAGSTNSKFLAGSVQPNITALLTAVGNNVRTITIPGAVVGDKIVITMAGATAVHVVLTSASITAVDTVTLNLFNITGAAVPGGVYTFNYIIYN
jgi:hypothetical protein